MEEVTYSITFAKEKKLGQGSFGSVWRVNTPERAPYSKTEHPIVALKEVKDPGEEAWTEVDLLKRIDHQHIAKYLFSFENERGDLYIIMEFCDGGTFADQVRVRVIDSILNTHRNFICLLSPA